MPKRLLTRGLAAALLGLAVTPAVASAGLIFPEKGGSPNADKIWTLYVLIFVLALLVFIGVGGALLWALFKFRARKGDVAAQIHGNTRLEIGWTWVATAFQRTAASTKKKDAVKIGGGAAGGAIIGALVGGKKGAAIGTAVGGGGRGASVPQRRSPAGGDRFRPGPTRRTPGCGHAVLGVHAVRRADAARIERLLCRFPRGETEDVDGAVGVGGDEVAAVGGEFGTAELGL